jgi:sterol desaturase/sphingolipid hydroxylase (fatty acid hydroxylase superfamily)
MQDATLLAIPLFIGLMLLELVLSFSRPVRGYEVKDTFASLAMGIGNRIVYAVIGAGLLAIQLWLYDHRLIDLGHGWWVFVLCFFAEDLAYYAFHRTSHEVRLLWAAHENHHSSERFNLSTALRQSWTTPFTTMLFYWPLSLLGFHPVMVMGFTVASLLYQFWIHTELIDRLGWFERWFNTPSHHRVHHGTNVEYLDRNHGGVLIVWDRLFGTFEPERAKVVYGLTKNIDTFNPLRVAFHEYAAIWRDVRRAGSWSEALGYVLRPPGWSPDGRTLTSDQMRHLAATR